MTAVELRKATPGDVNAIECLIALSARALSSGDYTPAQIEAALQGAWGVDTQLIRDETYFVGDVAGQLVACGGWSYRATDFGGDSYQEREPRVLDPEAESARIRAFFVHPAWARRGLGSALLSRCESEAVAAGFRVAELTATLPGVRLYASCGYQSLPPRQVGLPGGGTIEFVPMRKAL